MERHVHGVARTGVIKLKREEFRRGQTPAGAAEGDTCGRDLPKGVPRVAG
jgi:hypothetical protein